MNVTLKHLQAFVRVAQAGSFTRAARVLGLSQPALTTTVKDLEEELGVRLFDRTTRRVTVTGEGEQFLPVAERLLSDLENAVSDMRAVAESRRGRVGLATLPSVAQIFLPGVIAQFTQRHPGISIHLHDANASGVQRRVKMREVDFGIASQWTYDPDLSFTPILCDVYGVVCRDNHPLARGRDSIAWRELDGHAFLGLAIDTGIRPQLDRTPNLPESVRAPKHEVSNIVTLGSMLAAGLGISALPELAVPEVAGVRMHFRRLIDPVVEREIGIIRVAGRTLTPPAERLLQLIVEQASNSPNGTAQ